MVFSCCAGRLVLNVLPARLRCHDDRDLDRPLLKRRSKTLVSLASDLGDVFDPYAAPLLDECREPQSVARFLVRANTCACASRGGRKEPRFKRIRTPSAAALLFDAAGESSAALAFLEGGRAPGVPMAGRKARLDDATRRPDRKRARVFSRAKTQIVEMDQ